MDHSRDRSAHPGRVIRVMLVDDDLFVRTRLRNDLDSVPDLEVCGAYDSGHEAAAAIGEDRPHVVLVDIAMPEIDGPQTTLLLREASPGTQVLALTSVTDRQQAAAMLAAGALGFLPKDLPLDAMVSAIRTARHGVSVLAGAGAQLVDRTAPTNLVRLTRTERVVLIGLCDGQTAAEIGARHHLSRSMIYKHIDSLCTKLGANNRVTLAVRAVELGLY
ncbi:MAG: response regulator transcription factor [Micropruina sp.]